MSLSSEKLIAWESPLQAVASVCAGITGTQMSVLEFRKGGGEADALACMAVSREGVLLAAGTQHGRITVWETRGAGVVAALPGHEGPIRDGRTGTGSEEGFGKEGMSSHKLKKWQGQTKEELQGSTTDTSQT